tara:strand:+ start:1523 stop:2188 length:666 start_codon:yes stop_codon:yes gene_type:complete
MTTKNPGRSLQDILDNSSFSASKTNNRDSSYRNRFQKNYKSNASSSSRNTYYQRSNNKTGINANVSKENTYTCKNFDFPELVSNKSETLNNQLDFKTVVNKINYVPTITKKVNPGWSTIDYKTKKITTYDRNYKIVDNSVKTSEPPVITSEEIYSLYNKMSRRWCDYYDSINDLLGDRSPYINYEDEINQIVSEDNEILKKIYENFDDYLSSDDEFINFDD